jgi:drug/metabolite transporter (DMT)-like permease
MRSIKAILAGSLFIIVVGLFVELAYVFLAVGYNNLAKSYPFLNEVSGYLRYLIGIPIIFFVMFIGGVITADIARQKVLLHCLIVACITIGVMMVTAMKNMQMTLSGVVVSLLALVSVLSGGWYWLRETAKKRN